jgi:gamma-glutamylcyclotransferase (GGCT)/AIG2-like uncharacterized protein YtfP
MSERFFFYGTLMDETVRRLVLGPSARTLSLQPAVLDGWRRTAVRGRHYPVVVAASGASVAGLVTGAMSRAAVTRLDRFEGPEYVRRALAVRSPDGGATAWVYVARNATLSSAADWDYTAWCRQHRDRFLKRLAGGARRATFPAGATSPARITP